MSKQNQFSFVVHCEVFFFYLVTVKQHYLVETYGYYTLGSHMRLNSN